MDSWAYWFSYSIWRWDYTCRKFSSVDASNLAKMKDIEGGVCWIAITKQKFEEHRCHIKNSLFSNQNGQKSPKWPFYNLVKKKNRKLQKH
jgi:hypothetical protein